MTSPFESYRSNRKGLSVVVRKFLQTGLTFIERRDKGEIMVLAGELWKSSGSPIELQPQLWMRSRRAVAHANILQAHFDLVSPADLFEVRTHARLSAMTCVKRRAGTGRDGTGRAWVLLMLFDLIPSPPCRRMAGIYGCSSTWLSTTRQRWTRNSGTSSTGRCSTCSRLKPDMRPGRPVPCSRLRDNAKYSGDHLETIFHFSFWRC